MSKQKAYRLSNEALKKIEYLAKTKEKIPGSLKGKNTLVIEESININYKIQTKDKFLQDLAIDFLIDQYNETKDESIFIVVKILKERAIQKELEEIEMNKKGGNL
jgi:hypothetical protein